MGIFGARREKKTPSSNVSRFCPTPDKRALRACRAKRAAPNGRCARAERLGRKISKPPEIEIGTTDK